MAPTVEVHLPAAALKAELAKNGDSYRLRVSSPVLARSVYISFGELDAEVSDNYFDLLPGQTVEVTVKTAASEDALRSGLKVVTLADAFERTAAAQPARASSGTNPIQAK